MPAPVAPPPDCRTMTDPSPSLLPADRPRGRAGGAVIVLLTALVGFGPMSTDLYLPALPAMQTALATDVATIQLTLSVFLVGFAVSQLIYGPLSDRFGRRPLLIAGVALYTVASVGCAVATSVETLVAWRFLQAVGACCGPVLGRAVVRDLFEREAAARVMSYMAMAMALAPAIGPIIGGVLTEQFGWRSTLWTLVGFGAVILACLIPLLPETNRHKDPTATRPGRLLANWRTCLADRGFTTYTLIVAFSYCGIFTFISGSSFVFVTGLGLSPMAFGICFGAVVIGYMIGSFLSGSLTRRVGLDRMIRIGTAVQILGGWTLLALALIPPAGVGPQVLAIVLPVFVFMVGAGLTLPNAMAAAVSRFPRMAGLASSLLGFVQMGIAALVGIAVGHGTDGTALPMAVAFATLTALAAGLARRPPATGRGAVPGTSD